MSTMPVVDTAPGVAALQSPQPAHVVLNGLHERHAKRIFGFCRRRLRTPQEAEDAVQNTFISALQALQRGTVPVCEAAWLFKIAENACTAIYRSGARRDDRELTDPETLSRFAGPDGNGGADALVGLEAALDTIPENQRKAFVLRELRGLSYAEIAVQLGTSVASVETLIYRARRGLARALEGGAGLRGRLTGAIDLGSIAAAAKAWFGGLSAMKIGVATAVIAAASVPARDLVIHDTHSPARVPVQSIAQEPKGDPDSAGTTRSRSAPSSAHRSDRQRLPGSELVIGRRTAPSSDDHAGNEPPTRPAPSSQQPPPAASRTQEPESDPPAPGPAPPPPPTSPPPSVPALPATPVAIPDLAEPVSEAAPLPQIPSLPDVPAVPDPAETLSQLPQLP
jgi:RNA polymerase sigma-70 factor, ECF subfamily